MPDEYSNWGTKHDGNETRTTYDPVDRIKPGKNQRSHNDDDDTYDSRDAGHMDDDDEE